MTSIFLSHNQCDKPFVRKLACDLDGYGVRVWIDEAELKVGDSLIGKIREGIDKCEFLGVILSKISVESEWVQREVDIAMNQEIAGRTIKVLPLVIDECELPGFILGKLYLDFRGEMYHKSFRSLLDRLLPQLETVAPVTAQDLNKFCEHITYAAKKDKIIPFIGDYANGYNRTSSGTWDPSNSMYPPDDTELAKWLTEEFKLPSRYRYSLSGICQEILVKVPYSFLYDALTYSFSSDNYNAGCLHEFLASSANEWGSIIFTDNYDDILEKTLHKAGIPFELMVYSPIETCFVHIDTAGIVKHINMDNCYAKIINEEILTVVKLRGGVTKARGYAPEYMITEDDYEAYPELNRIFPVQIRFAIHTSHHLLFGIRGFQKVFYRKIDKLDDLKRYNYNCWATEINPTTTEYDYWLKNFSVETINVTADTFVNTLSQFLCHSGKRI